jgi:peptidoglycan/xylan/chitin deacetylase (PgdA/CDA1 family)
VTKLRVPSAVAVCLLTATALALAVLTAGTPAVPARAAVPDPSFLSLQQGVVTVAIHTTKPLTPAAVVSAKPCVRLRHRSGLGTTICLRTDAVRVYQSDRHPFTAPAQLAMLKPRRWLVTVRQADLMIPRGTATAQLTCRSNCVPGSQVVTVPALQLTGCQAEKPWLRYSGDAAVGKAVAFTFDDGPGQETRATMRILRRARVPGTFFLIGRMIGQYPKYLPRLLRAGDALGNHTWSHPVMNGSDSTQITRTQRRITRASGFVPCLFRAPYGLNPRPVVDLAEGLNLTTVNWNVDPRDWTGADPTVIRQTTLREVRPGSIAVFHDGSQRTAFLKALPGIIATLKHRGYRFLTVPELLQLPTTYRS